MVATVRRCKSPTNELLVIFYAEFVKQKSSDVVVPVYADNFLTFVLSLSLSLCLCLSVFIMGYFRLPTSFAFYC